MSAVLEAAPSSVASAPARGRGVWAAAWRRLRQDRVGMFSLAVVAAFLVLIVLAALHLVAASWQQERAVPSAPPTFIGPAPPPAPGNDAIPVPKGPPVDISDVDPLAPRYREWADLAARYRTVERPKAQTLALGADRLGRDVLSKTLKATQTSVFVGLLAALVATAIGTLLGALAGFFGRWVNDSLEWLYSVFTAIPDILLILTFAVIFGRGIASVALILAFVGWTGVYRQVRAEFIKHASREYVRSAEAIGASAASRMFRHILPNASHVILVRMSLLVVGFIKAEVILSYLGLGVGVDDVSWGTMLAEAQSELILGHWWQLAAATGFMAVFVTAFSLMTDALRDALDPRLRGLG
jgi:peptide/nickel transport system permease protein